MATAADINPEPAPRDLSGPPALDVVMSTDDAPTVPDQTTAPASKQVADSIISNVKQTDAPNHEGPSVQSPVSSSPAHITRPLSPLHSSPQAQTEDVTMTPVADAPNAPLEPLQTPVSQPSANLPPAPPAAAPVVQTFAKSPDNGASAPVFAPPQPHLENHATKAYLRANSVNVPAALASVNFKPKDFTPQNAARRALPLCQIPQSMLRFNPQLNKPSLQPLLHKVHRYQLRRTAM
ncbi:hypothetical protein FRC12_025140 [Ceratobasidium sp. 428]|nr:hypothetical protein FRC12_025140 [Ceratobasidium sp. 428]